MLGVSQRNSVLVVDDEKDFLDLYQSILGDNYDVVTASSYQEGIFKFKNQEFDLIIADFNMPGKTGEELIKDIRYIEEVQKREEARILIVSACLEQFEKKIIKRLFVRPLRSHLQLKI